MKTRMRIGNALCGLRSKLFAAALGLLSSLLLPQSTAQAQEIALSYTDRFTLAWWDRGSGANLDGSFWVPTIPAGQNTFAFGHAGMPSYGPPSSMVVGEAIVGSAFAHPTGFTWIWNDAGSGANLDGAFWNPIPPAGYVSLGTVTTDGNAPSTLSVVCVRSNLVVEGTVGDLIWNTVGSGANLDFSAWKIVAPPGAVTLGTFIGTAGYAKPTGPVYCLNGSAIVPPAASHGATLKFDGYDDYAYAPHNGLPSPTATFTTEAWIKINDGTERYIVTGSDNSSFFFGVGVNGGANVGKLSFWLYLNGVGSGWLYGTSSLNDSRWHHVAGTYDGATMKVYVDGQLENSVAKTGNLSIGSQPLYLGARPGGYHFFGLMDEVRFWNVARSQAAIQSSLNTRLTGKEPGLFAYFPMDEGAGTTTADASGHANTATLVNGPLWNIAEDAVTPVALAATATLVTNTSVQLNGLVNTYGATTTNRFEWGAASTALDFSGASQYITATPTNVPIGNSQYTVEAWIKPDVMNGGGIVGWGAYGANNQVNALRLESNGLRNYWWNNDLVAPVGSLVGAWHHVAATFDGVTRRIMLDGNVVASDTPAGHNVPTTSNFAVGKTSTAEFFDGQMDEVRIWNVARTPVQIQANLNTRLAGNEPGLVAYYPMDEGSGPVTADASGHGNIGTLLNSPVWSPGARPVLDQVTSWQPVAGSNSVLNLDGVDDHVTVPAGNWFGNEFTIESWVFERSYNSWERIIDFGNGAGGDNVIFGLSWGTSGQPNLQIAPFNQSVVSPNPIPLNEWVHLAVTVKTNTATIYVNGVVVVSGPVAAPNAVTRINNYIGRSNWGGNGYANALFDDVRIWNVARTPDQIRQFSTQPVSPGDPNLVLNYRFDEPSGTTAVDSRSTSPQNGTLANGAGRLASVPVSAPLANLVPGTVYHYRSAAQSSRGLVVGNTERFVTPAPVGGTDLKFDGVDDYVRIANFGRQMPTTEVTVEFWQRVRSLKGQSTFILSPDSGGNRFNAHVPWSDGWVYWDFGGSRLQYLPPQSIVGTWQHFALVSSVSGTYMRIYRNGALEASQVGSSQFTRGQWDLILGGLGFDGELDEVRIWNVARTPSQIQAGTMGQLAGNEPGLVAYYRMDEGAGGTLRDATVNANHGLLVNGPLRLPSTVPPCGVATNFTIGNTAYYQGYQPGITRIATAPVPNLVVSNLCANISPAAGTAGVDLTDGYAGLNLTLKYAGGVWANLTSGDNAAGLRVRSAGGNGADGVSGGIYGDGTDGSRGADGGTVTVNSTGNLKTSGNGAPGIVGISQAGNGGNGGYGGSIDGNGGWGGNGADGRAVSITGEGQITTSGFNSIGVFAVSQAGWGGAGGIGRGTGIGGRGGLGGDGGTATVDGSWTIQTLGDSAYGASARSLGGAGGPAATGGWISGSGGDGGGSGDGATATVNLGPGGTIDTWGKYSHGIFAQSIGGFAGGGGSGDSIFSASGGNGGSAGSGGNVNVTNRGVITTRGHGAHAVFAESVGGGGGGAGSGSGLFDGGGGGSSAGGNGGLVMVNNQGQLTTFNNFARGIFAQSVGGSGGDGATDSGLFYSVGAAGGKGGRGDTVTVTNRGQIATRGSDASGLHAQSVGGGGGTGGGAVAVGVFGSGAVGGRGGPGGNGAQVNVYSGASGSITNLGDRSHGIFAQSVGGGGGNGGFAISGAGSLTFAGAVGIGGNGGVAGGGSNVVVNSQSAISTGGKDAHGIFAQSVGGGGGSGGYSITVSGGVGGAAALSLGGKGGSGGSSESVAVTTSGQIHTGGDHSYGILAQSVGGGGGDGGFSIAGSVAVGAAVPFSFGGDGGVGGVGGDVAVNSQSQIFTGGKDAHGIFVQSVGGGGGSGGYSVSGGISGGGQAGAAFGGKGGSGTRSGNVSVTTTNLISTVGNHSYGILGQSVGGGGGDGGFSVAGGIGGVASVNFAMGGSGGAGGVGGNVALNSASSITTAGTNSHAIFAQSVGGGGGSGGFSVGGSIAGGAAVSVAIGGPAGSGASASDVTVTSSGTLNTSSEHSYGILAQSLGGGGGDGGFSVAGGISGGPTVSFAMGGSGGSGGVGGNVALNSASSITTAGTDSHAIFAQSVGGGGGSGGFSVAGGIAGGAAVSVAIGGPAGSGASASDVTVTSSGTLNTSSEHSYGILAQSLGGGGGDGGFSVAGGISGGPTVSFAMGGSGGSGGVGGKVVINSASSITTSNADSHAIFAQSVGGGGGSGGFSVAGGISSSAAVSAGIGGKGGTGANSATVALTSTGTNITTSGDHSYGLLAQSIGGGGGDGGFSVAGGISIAPSVNFSMGGGGGVAGHGATVAVTNRTAITTHGRDSHGIFVQSVGGGGGSGGFSVAGGISASGTAISASIGGGGTNGGTGGNVILTNSGAISTSGEHSYGVLAQSIGGGGGDGGFSVAGSISQGPAITFSMGGGGGPGGNGAAVDVGNSGNIFTGGELAYGILAQSVGGGGGSGGFSVAGSLSANSGGLGFSLGGSAGSGADAARVNVVNSGNITTTNKGSHAIMAQSVGGGGGAGGFGGALAGGFGNGAKLAVGIGGKGGSGGNGSNVVVRSTGSNVVTRGVASYGVFAQSVGGGGGDGGAGLAASFGTQPNAVNLALGIGRSGGSGGTGGAVAVNNASAIETDGIVSHGIVSQSIGGGGGNGGFSAVGTLGTSPGAKQVSVSVGGSGGGGGSAGNVGVTNSGRITTLSSVTGTIPDYGTNHATNALSIPLGSVGILAQSIGGGGGNGGSAFAGSFGGPGTKNVSVAVGGGGGDGNSAGAVTVQNSGVLETWGENSHGILAQSIGGGGGNGGSSFSGAISGGGLNISIALGGSGGTGGSGNTVNVVNDGGIETFGNKARAVFAQSIGGGGGNGGWSAAVDLAFGTAVQIASSVGGSGGSGGIGGNVSVVGNGSVLTRGEDSEGVFAQSIGGGGGNGGSSLTAVGVLAAEANIAVSRAVGGSGGTGNRGGTVAINRGGDIETRGDGSHGVFAQSVGGGGGTGGSARSVNLFLKPTPVASGNVSLDLSIGGSGGSGGVGGNVGVTNVGNITTRGGDAHGILAQSIGGGGGTAGNGNSGLSNLGIPGDVPGSLLLKPIKSKSISLNIAVGGDGGTGNDGGAVKVQQLGNITTLSDGAYGILAQSVGAGGGVGGNGAIGLTGHIGIGGKGNAAGNGGAVDVKFSGLLDTTGDGAHGIFAQSVGGGGGVAGDVVRGFKNQGLNVGKGLAFGQGGGSAGDGGNVVVNSSNNIITHGTGASGIFAQSVGGGGGVAGNLGNDLPGLSLLNFSGSVGGAGSAGEVSVHHTGNITTTNVSAHGIFAQSAGGRDGFGGDVEVVLAGEIAASGADSDGIFAQSRGDAGNGNIDVTVLNGGVQGGAGLGAGVRIFEGANNTLNNHGTISSLSGWAIIGTGGNETIHNYGTVLGSVNLGAGRNAFNNYSGATLNLGGAGTLNLGAGNALTNSGLLTGSGQIIGNVVSGGTIAADNSTGNFTTGGGGNLLLDGEFELGLTTGPGTFIYRTNFGRWTVSAGTVALLCMPYAGMPPYEGAEALNVGDSFGAGAVRQSFATTIGQKYWLSLAVIGYGGGGGTVRATVSNGSDTNLIADFVAPGGNVWGTNNYEFVATSSLSTLQLQNVAGACTIDDVRVTPDPTNVVAIAPGNTAGSLTIDGSLSLLASANLTFEIGGRVQGTTYDFLRVTTSAQLAGTLHLSLLNNFLPSMTDTFTLMEFGSSSGQFMNMLSGGRIRIQDNSGSFQMSLTSTNLQLSDFQLLEVGMRISLQRNGSGHMVLQFPGVSGNRYAVEYRAELASGNWTAVTAPVFTFPTAAVGQWIDDGSQTGGLGGARFYRLVQLP